MPLQFTHKDYKIFLSHNKYTTYICTIARVPLPSVIEMNSLHNPVHPWPCDPLSYASQVLEFQACSIMLGLDTFFCIFYLNPQPKSGLSNSLTRSWRSYQLSLFFYLLSANETYIHIAAFTIINITLSTMPGTQKVLNIYNLK